MDLGGHPGDRDGRLGLGRHAGRRVPQASEGEGGQRMTAVRNPLLDLIGIDLPIIQAPMAGTSSPAMAAAVANAGGLGSLGLASVNAKAAQAAIAATRERSNRALNVNVFCHQPAKADAAKEAAWTQRFKPEFDRFEAVPPAALTEIYPSFVADDDMLKVLVAERPKV